MTVYVGTRDVVLVRGADAASYLQGQISQDVDAIDVGSSAWSLILQPQGKIEAWFRISRTGDDSFLLDVDAGFGQNLLDRLRRFLLRVDVDLELHTWVHHGHDEPVEADAPIVAGAPWGQGTDVIGPDLPAPSSPRLSETERRRRRILAGVPAMGAELDESTIPASAGIVDRSVSFTKGCYTGQELVARIDSRGDNTPSRLRILEGTGSVPDIGAVLTDNGDEVASITSAATDESGEGWVALAYVRRKALERSVLDLAGKPVSVRPVPDHQ